MWGGGWKAMSFVSVSCGMKMKNIRVSVGGSEFLDNEARPWGGFSYLWQSPAAPVNSMGMGKSLAGAQQDDSNWIPTPWNSGNGLPRLNVSDIFTDDFHCLRHIKGRRVRTFAPVPTKLAASLATNVRGKHIHASCKCMEEVYGYCDRKQFVWNAEAGQEFADKCEALLAHYSWLAKDSMKQGKCMFSVVQKHHLFARHPSQCRYLAT